MLQSKKATVPKAGHLKRFDMICVELFPELSRKKIKSIIDNGGAYLNKKRLKVAKSVVKIGDSIELCWDDKQSKNAALTQENFIYENDDFIILNKPAGIAVQGTLESDNKTILHSIHKFNPKKYSLNQLFLVHRLDKDTSGLMIIAKTQETQKIFEDLFREHKINKTYKALCYFTPKESTGVINYPIAKDVSRKNTYFAVTTDKKYPHQKSAETLYSIEKHFAHNTCLIKCTPKTGRTHQIRVHLASIGCPIVGDKTYAQNIYGHPYAKIALRHLLHACELSFEFKKKNYFFESKFPSEMLKTNT